MAPLILSLISTNPNPSFLHSFVPRNPNPNSRIRVKIRVSASKSDPEPKPIVTRFSRRNPKPNRDPKPEPASEPDSKGDLGDRVIRDVGELLNPINTVDNLSKLLDPRKQAEEVRKNVEEVVDFLNPFKLPQRDPKPSFNAGASRFNRKSKPSSPGKGANVSDTGSKAISVPKIPKNDDVSGVEKGAALSTEDESKSDTEPIATSEPEAPKAEDVSKVGKGATLVTADKSEEKVDSEPTAASEPGSNGDEVEGALRKAAEDVSELLNPMNTVEEVSKLLNPSNRNPGDELSKLLNPVYQVEEASRRAEEVASFLNPFKPPPREPMSKSKSPGKSAEKSDPRLDTEPVSKNQGNLGVGEGISDPKPAEALKSEIPKDKDVPKVEENAALVTADESNGKLATAESETPKEKDVSRVEQGEALVIKNELDVKSDTKPVEISEPKVPKDDDVLGNEKGAALLTDDEPEAKLDTEPIASSESLKEDDVSRFEKGATLVTTDKSEEKVVSEQVAASEPGSKGDEAGRALRKVVKDTSELLNPVNTVEEVSKILNPNNQNPADELSKLLNPVNQMEEASRVAEEVANILNPFKAPSRDPNPVAKPGKPQSSPNSKPEPAATSGTETTKEEDVSRVEQGEDLVTTSKPKISKDENSPGVEEGANLAITDEYREKSDTESIASPDPEFPKDKLVSEVEVNGRGEKSDTNLNLKPVVDPSKGVGDAGDKVDPGVASELSTTSSLDALKDVVKSLVEEGIASGIIDDSEDKMIPKQVAASQPDLPKDKDVVGVGEEASTGMINESTEKLGPEPNESEPDVELKQEEKSADDLRINGTQLGSDEKLSSLKRMLVGRVYESRYGLTVSADARGEILELVNLLEVKNVTQAPMEKLDGNWILLYTAFSELSPLIAVGSIPLVKVNQISQSINTKSMTVINAATVSDPFASYSFSAIASFEVRGSSRIQVRFKEADFQLPQISPSVDMPADIDIFGQKINLRLLQQSLNPLQEFASNITRNISGLAPLKVPISGIVPPSWLLSTYIDDDIRISKGVDGSLFIYGKEGSRLLDRFGITYTPSSF